MADPKPPADLKQWHDLATKERIGKDPTDLVWHTPEGLDFLDTLPGTFPSIVCADIIQYTSQEMPKFNSISHALRDDSTPCSH